MPKAILKLLYSFGFVTPDSFVFCIDRQTWYQVGQLDEFGGDASAFSYQAVLLGDEKVEIDFDSTQLSFEDENAAISYWQNFLLSHSGKIIASLFGDFEQGISRKIESELSEFRAELAKGVQTTLAKNIAQGNPVGEGQASALNEILSKLEVIDRRVDHTLSNWKFRQSSDETFREQNEKLHHQLEGMLRENTQLKLNNQEIISKYEQVVKKLKLAKDKIRELHQYRDKYRDLVKDKKEKSSISYGHGEGPEDTRAILLDSIPGVEQLKEQTTNPTVEMESRLKLSKSYHQNKSGDESQQLTGEYFEAFNYDHWFVKKMEPTGPHHLKKLLQARDDGDLVLDSLVKENEGDIWRPVREFVELCAPIKIVEDFDSSTGEKRERYLIKRSSYRAPFYEVVGLEVNSKKMRGYCTSLSLGGCFVELSKQEVSHLKTSETGHVTFYSGVLGKSFQVKFEIKNIGTKKPRGIGVSFVEISSAIETAINEYISYHLKEKNRAA